MIIHPSLLDLDLCLDVVRHIDDTLLKESIWRINKTNWQSNLTRGYNGPVYLGNFREHALDFDKKICWQIQDSGHFTREINWKETQLVMQVWDYGSGCNWHSDNHCDFACTIYLNDIWKEEWGGLLKYQLHGEERTVVPEIGKMVINTNQVLHMVTEQQAPHFRYTLQCFGKYQ